jgi:hypothetical protein
MKGWGKPDQNKTKLSFSFYLASDVIQSHLGKLRQNPTFAHYLHVSGLNMASHALLETNSKQIGFFLGKSPAHTWREDISSRMNIHLAANMPKKPIPNGIKVSAGLPTTERCVPIQVKNGRIIQDGEEAWAVAAFVGIKDMKAVECT